MSERSDHEVWGNEAAVLIHEHHAVCISVIDDTDISFDLSDELLKIHDILEIKRIRLVVREASVKFFIYIYDG